MVSAYSARSLPPTFSAQSVQRPRSFVGPVRFLFSKSALTAPALNDVGRIAVHPTPRAFHSSDASIASPLTAWRRLGARPTD